MIWLGYPANNIPSSLDLVYLETKISILKIFINIKSTLILPLKPNKSYYSSIVTNKFSNIHEHRKIS